MASDPSHRAEREPPAAPTAASPPRPWKQATLWLAFLAPFFYLSYGFANHLAAQRVDVGAVVFDWERRMPFVAWTIIPYWSINLFYGLSLFLCRTCDELHTHGRRLLTAQIIAVGCFLLFPLGFSFARPESDGIPGMFFAALASFDKPFNQAPSLHIALLVILWDLYRRLLPQNLHWLLHGWSLLIAVSVLTTYQHHFIDIPTGALLGVFCLWLWPLDASSPLRTACLNHDPKRRRLAMFYAIGAAVCFGTATVGGIALWLCWPGIALLMVALQYAVFGVEGFQKNDTGRMSHGARWLLAPYRLGAWINSRLWTAREAPSVQIATRVWLGRMPTAAQARALGIARIVDVSAELSTPTGIPTRCVPMLDLIAPTPAQLAAAAEAIDAQLRDDGDVLVCCALGYSRSAAAVAAWLLQTGRADNADEAVERIRRLRPQLVLHAAHRLALSQLELHE
jgi:protein-tyrosine phosphatase/membrane-associated phospholipid phosphatase